MAAVATTFGVNALSYIFLATKVGGVFRKYVPLILCCTAVAKYQGNDSRIAPRLLSYSAPVTYDFGAGYRQSRFYRKA